MNKLLLLSLTLILIFQSKSQVVFCPPGAEWHSLFSGAIFFPGNTFNEQIKYTGDSIEGLDTIKILSHNRFFMTCGPYTNATLIKQKGDTIFFKNKFSQNTWQILYNYATPVNQSWQTTLTTLSQTKTVTYTVQAIGTTTVNGLSLKQMTVSSSDWGGTVITERFGSNAFLFNFISRSLSSCDGDMFIEFLCYKDNSFGAKQFGEKACDYYTRNSVGLEKYNQPDILTVFPNPTNDHINIQATSTLFSNKNITLRLLNIAGVEVLNKLVSEEDLKASKIKLDLSNFEKGIYFLGIFSDGKFMATQKILKE